MPTALSQDILIKCNVNLYGQGDQILIFSQSLTENQTVWRHQISELGKQFKCLTFDFVGVGKSDIRGQEAQRYIDVNHHLEDFLAILDRLNIDEAHFIGHGLGGNIGILAAAQYPQLFKSLHMIDVAPKYLRCEEFDGYFTKDEFEQLWKALARDYLSWSELIYSEDRHYFQDNEKLQALYSSLKALRPDFAQAALRIKYDIDQRDLLPLLQGPIHIYHSLKEPVIALWISEYYGETLPHVQIQILNSEGRHPQLTTPDEVNQKLKKYLPTQAIL